MDSLNKFFTDGGPFLSTVATVLSIMMFVGFSIIVERLYRIRIVYHADAARLMQKIQRFVLNNNIEEAVKICNSKKKAVIYQIFRAALVNADKPFEEIQDHVEVARLAVIPKLQERVPYLFTIANVTTLIGLLGTVVGLITTFEAVGAVESSQKQQLLSAGISTALNSTAFGLTVAIPCMLAYGYLLNRISNFLDEIEHYSARLLILLRTGSQYFENFNPDASMTTAHTPKKHTREKSKDAA